MIVINQRIQSFLSKPNQLLILFLLVIAILVTYYKLLVLFKMGLQWDSYDFLAGAFYFAGQGFGYVDFFRPPLLPFLTVIPLKLGLVSEMALSLVDGVLFILGVTGLYLLFKLRFNNNINSFIGVLFFISFPVVLLWLGVGYTDLASLSLSIWAVYLTVLAVKKDQRFFYISFPVLALAFLTRFSAAIFLFPIFFYLIVNKNTFQIKKALCGIIVSILIMVPVLLFFNEVLGNPARVFLNFYSGSVATVVVSGFANSMDSTFYIKNSLYGMINLNFLNNSSLAVNVIFLVVLVGFLFAILIGFTRYLNQINGAIKKIDFQKYKILLITPIILFIIFILTLGKLNYLISDVLFLIVLYLIYNIIKTDNIKDLDLDFLFISWFISYLVFISFYPIKVTRYLIPLTPAIAYFITVGWSQFNGKLKGHYLPSLSSVVLIVVLLISTTVYIHDLEYDPIASGDNFHITPTTRHSSLKPLPNHSVELYTWKHTTLKATSKMPVSGSKTTTPTMKIKKRSYPR